MRWPWSKCNPQEEPPVQPRFEADEQGLNEAHEALDVALSRWPEVTLMTTAMRGIRQRNHLAEKAYEAMRGHPR